MKSMRGLEIFVIDNGSSDKTAQIAKSQGVKVLYVNEKGKGNALRRAFAKIDADIYVIVDGDDTYDPYAVNKMVDELIENDLDMVVGVRKQLDKLAYRIGHKSGNLIFNKFFSFLFGNKFSDIFSGYRVLSGRLVKSFPAHSEGFEIETELCVHCINLHLSTSEIETEYTQRPKGSKSKLNTLRDGFKILLMMIRFFSWNKPITFYGILSLVCFVIFFLLSFPVFYTYFQTGEVPRLPTFVLSIGFLILSVLLFNSGIILRAMLIFQSENRRQAYITASKNYKITAGD